MSARLVPRLGAAVVALALCGLGPVQVQAVAVGVNIINPYAQQGRVAGLLYFSWNSDPAPSSSYPGSVWRCGALTEAGKLALSPQ
jgi:hypothetical protein